MYPEDTTDGLRGSTADLFPDTMPPEQQEWYASYALSVDPTQGGAYDHTVRLLKEFAGVDDGDAEQDYTYYGLPAAALSPTIFEEF